MRLAIRRHFGVVLVALGTLCQSVALASDDPVTSGQALTLAKTLCASSTSKPTAPVHWMVYSADRGTDVENKKGDSWLVDGEYFPKTSSGAVSAINMMVWIPKNGAPPDPCMAVTN